MGFLSAYANCHKTVNEPIRRPVKILEELRTEYPFLNIEFEPQTRIVKSYPTLPIYDAPFYISETELFNSFHSFFKNENIIKGKKILE